MCGYCATWAADLQLYHIGHRSGQTGSLRSWDVNLFYPRDLELETTLTVHGRVCIGAQRARMTDGHKLRRVIIDGELRMIPLSSPPGADGQRSVAGEEAGAADGRRRPGQNELDSDEEWGDLSCREVSRRAFLRWIGWKVSASGSSDLAVCQVGSLPGPAAATSVDTRPLVPCTDLMLVCRECRGMLGIRAK